MRHDIINLLHHMDQTHACKLCFSLCLELLALSSSIIWIWINYLHCLYYKRRVEVILLTLIQNQATFIAFYSIESVIREHFHIYLIYNYIYDNAFGMQILKHLICHLIDKCLLTFLLWWKRGTCYKISAVSFLSNWIFFPRCIWQAVLT